MEKYEVLPAMSGFNAPFLSWGIREKRTTHISALTKTKEDAIDIARLLEKGNISLGLPRKENILCINLKYI